MPHDLDPFRAPTAAIGAPTRGDSGGDAAAIRLPHLKHETSDKSLGTLAYVGSGFLLLCNGFYVVAAVGLVPELIPEGQDQLLVQYAMALTAGLTLVGSAVAGGVGFGLRRLQAWSRWPTLVLALLGVGVIAFYLMVATLMNPAITAAVALVCSLPLIVLGTTYSLMAASKANVVFSGDYHEAVRQTSHIKCRTPLLVKLVFGLLVGIVGCFLLVVLINGIWR